MQDNAQKARQALAELEADFKKWRELPRDDSMEESLDTWIIRLGDARHAESFAVRELNAAKKIDR